jgi:Tol biopolymer transport system component
MFIVSVGIGNQDFCARVCRSGTGIGAPNFSPDGKKILFTYGPVDDSGNCQCDLYVTNVDGSELTNLTNDGLSYYGHWSPDASRVVFASVSLRTGQTVITTMRADGTGGREILSDPAWNSFGNAFTPDGRNIVMDSEQQGLVSALWTMNDQGRDQKRITRSGLEGCVLDVSPNGKYVLIVNHCNSNIPGGEIFQAGIDGKGVKQLTDPGKGKVDIPGGYSPNGEKIVFISNRMSSDGSLDLFTANSDGTNIHRIATGLTVGGCPDDECVTPSWGPQSK